MTYQTLINSKFYRWKLYHVPFWCIYHYLWVSVTFANPIKAASNILYAPYSIKYIFYVVFECLAVYFNLYFLMPRFLEKRRFGIYFSLLASTVVVTAVCIVGGYYFGSFVTGRGLGDLYGNGANCFYYFMGYALPSAFASMTLAMTIKLTKNWFHAERVHQQLKQDKLESELKLLKQQFNPHFLFNSINSIFFLIHKNPSKASASLAKFSELLRHQLYECNDHLIPLSKELSYLNNYIELEKLRHGSRIQVSVEIEDSMTGHLAVAPFVLMTFVENAFKHVSMNSQGDEWISVTMRVIDTKLNLAVSNSKAKNEGNGFPRNGGIGLVNVRRRLDLVYENCYNLKIDDQTSRFDVTLDLKLSEMAYGEFNDSNLQPA
ncbi:MAG TPA: histidine kinase [Chryseolinea sp.]|nr:histidine kinase [Chryseolinea sp.]